MKSINRRNFLMTGGAAAGVAVASTVLGSLARAKSDPPAPTTPLERVIAATTACISAGEACLAHCTEELAHGNVSMANCHRNVQQMLATCTAMLKLAHLGSAFAAHMAAVCADVCDACAEACHEHADHWEHGMHLQCKACYEACQECAAACRALLG